MFLLFLFSLVRNVRKTTNPKIWAGVLEEIPLIPSNKSKSETEEKAQIERNLQGLWGQSLGQQTLRVQSLFFLQSLF